MQSRSDFQKVPDDHCYAPLAVSRHDPLRIAPHRAGPVVEQTHTLEDACGGHNLACWPTATYIKSASLGAFG